MLTYKAPAYMHTMGHGNHSKFDGGGGMIHAGTGCRVDDTYMFSIILSKANLETYLQCNHTKPGKVSSAGGQVNPMAKSQIARK